MKKIKHTTFGKALRYYRKKRKLTGEQFGKIWGCDKSYVSQWETDRKHLNPESIQKFCDATGIEIIEKHSYYIKDVDGEEMVFKLEPIKYSPNISKKG